MARIGFVSDVQEVFTLPSSSLDIQVWQIPDRQLKSGRSPWSSARSRRLSTDGSRSAQSNIELMAEKEILGFKPALRLDHIGDKHSERVQDRKHRPE
jgi:hypothetical protein